MLINNTIKKSKLVLFFMTILLLLIFCNLNSIFHALIGLPNIGSPIILICTILIFFLLPIQQDYFGKKFLLLITFLVIFMVYGLLALIINLPHHAFLHVEAEAAIREIVTTIIILLATYVFSIWCIRYNSEAFLWDIVFYLFFFTLLLGILSPYIGLDDRLLVENKNKYRAYGLFVNPNENGLQANLTIILAYFLFLTKRLPLLPFLGIAALCFYVAFISFSKTAMLTIGIGFIIFLIYLVINLSNLGKKLSGSVLTLFVIMVLSVYIVTIYFSSNSLKGLHNTQVERLSEITQLVLERKFNRETTTHRSDLLKNGIEKIREQPLGGYGLGTFSVGGMVHSRHGVHNMYLKILGEAGIVVFMFFAFILCYYVFVGFQLFSVPQGFLFLSFLLVFSIFSFTSHNVFGLKFLMGFLGILLATIDEVRNPSFINQFKLVTVKRFKD